MEEGVSSQIIIKGYRTAARLAENKIKEIAVKIEKGDRRDTLLKLATTAMSSKLIKRNSAFFAKSTLPPPLLGVLDGGMGCVFGIGLTDGGVKWLLIQSCRWIKKS